MLTLDNRMTSIVNEPQFLLGLYSACSSTSIRALRWAFARSLNSWKAMENKRPEAGVTNIQHNGCRTSLLG